MTAGDGQIDEPHAVVNGVPRWVVSGSLASAAVLFAACTTTMATTRPRASTAKPTTTTASLAASATACLNDQLAVVPMNAIVGAGEAAQQLGFINISTSTCTLEGWPTVNLLNAAGVQVTQATPSPIDPGQPPISLVTLAPGQTATTLVQGGDGSVVSSQCAVYPWFVVTPPGLTQPTPAGSSLSTKVAVGLPVSASGFYVCGKTWIYPVSPIGSEHSG
jgi:hypothetical protein